MAAGKFTYRTTLNASNDITVECVAWDEDDGFTLDEVYLVEPNGSVGRNVQIEDLSDACQSHLREVGMDRSQWEPSTRERRDPDAAWAERAA